MQGYGFGFAGFLFGYGNGPAGSVDFKVVYLIAG